MTKRTRYLGNQDGFDNGLWLSSEKYRNFIRKDALYRTDYEKEYIISYKKGRYTAILIIVLLCLLWIIACYTVAFPFTVPQSWDSFWAVFRGG